MVTEVSYLYLMSVCPQYDYYIIPGVLEKLAVSIIRVQEEW
jgi:hypothetical protein